MKTEGSLSSPGNNSNALIWGLVAVAFGSILIYAAFQEQKFWYSVAGICVIVVGVPFFFQYKRTTIDLAARTVMRKEGGLFGSSADQGAIEDVTKIGVRTGLDLKNHKFWDVTVGFKDGREIQWHYFTYLGHDRMQKDVAELESIFGMKAEWVNEPT